jgi:hypothetical protein
MKKNMSSLFVVLAGVVFMGSLVFADLGLAGIVAGSQGAPAVGQAVLAAAKAVYANNTDPAVVEQQLIAILNEAVATGNESAIRYALVAVMMAGGEEHRSQSVSAINNSNAFSQYASLTAITVAAVEKLMGSPEKTGGGDTDGKGGGDQGKGGGDRTQGGGLDRLFLMGFDPDNPFTWESLTGPGDNDVDATET